MQAVKSKVINIIDELKIEHENLKLNKINREVSERFKVQSWKGCVGAIPPRVRIPSSLFFIFFI